MADFFKKVFTQISDFFLGLSSGRKAALVGLGMVVIVGMGALFYWASLKAYRPLMTNLNPEDSTHVIRFLREKGIPFRVDPNGRNIEIPPEEVFNLRLELATQGLPQSSVVGYEVFDQQALGTPSFVQHVNKKRALEGELMRTIRTMKGVSRARVHLSLPKKSTFVEDQKPPKASVILDLDPGVRLSEKQVYGIGNLVASAVEGLDVSGVTIVNTNGKLLSKNERDPLVAMSASQLDFKRKLEENFESQIKNLLSPVVGEGRVVANVAAELDFSRVSEVQKSYDPDGAAVRSVVRDNTSMDATRPGPYGPPGAVSNDPEQNPPVANQVQTNTKKGKEVTNYEVPQVVRETQKEVGKVTKLSVAVIVDGKRVKETGEDGVVQSKVLPWTPEKIAEFKQVVTTAVGLDPKRGDTLEIRNIEFNQVDFTEAEELISRSEKRAYLKNLAIYLVIALLIGLFFVFVVRPFIKWVTENTIDSVDTFLPQTIEELEKIQQDQNLPGLEDAVPELPDKIDPEKVEGEMIKEKIITLIDSSPQKAALILRDWIRGEKSKPNAAAGEGGKSKTA